MSQRLPWKNVLHRSICKIIDAPFDFAFSTVMNAMTASLFAMIPSFGLMFIMWLLYIPLAWLFGEPVVKAINNFVEDVMYQISWVILFVTMMLDDLGLQNVKTYFKKQWKQWRRERGTF